MNILRLALIAGQFICGAVAEDFSFFGLSAKKENYNPPLRSQRALR
jgi:hypothetical protein